MEPVPPCSGSVSPNYWTTTKEFPPFVLENDVLGPQHAPDCFPEGLVLPPSASLKRLLRLLARLRLPAVAATLALCSVLQTAPPVLRPAPCEGGSVVPMVTDEYPEL